MHLIVINEYVLTGFLLYAVCVWNVQTAGRFRLNHLPWLVGDRSEEDVLISEIPVLADCSQDL